MRLITRAGNDFTDRFPFIAMALKSLPARSCMIDGEAIVCNENGFAVFDLIRGHGSKRPRSFAPSTYWNPTERTCGDARSRSEKAYWQNCSTIAIQI